MYTMGGVFLFIGLFLFFRDQVGLASAINKRFPPDVYDKIYGIIASAYGIWRIYRAYKTLHPKKNSPDA